MAIAPVPAFPFPRRPFSSITPFTYSDAMTHLELLEKLRAYAGVILPAEINKVLDEYSIEITAEVQAAIDLMIGLINDKIIEIDDALADQQDDYTQKISDLTAYVDDAVQQIINSSITVQDPVVSALVEDEASMTRGSLDSVFRLWTSVKEFGAVGDGETDDTAAIQAAVDSGHKALFYPEGEYYIQGQLNFHVDGQVHAGTMGHSALNSGRSVLIRDFEAPTAMVNVSGYGNEFRNIGFQNYAESRTSGDQALSFIRPATGPGGTVNQSIDAVLSHVFFSGWDTCVYYEGQGLRVDNLAYSKTRVGFELNFPENFTIKDGSVQSGPFAGFRMYKFSNVRSHGNRGPLVLNTGTFAEYIRALYIDDVVSDHLGRLIEGGASGSVIENVKFNAASGGFIRLTENTKNAVFNNITVVGRPEETDPVSGVTVPKSQPPYGLYVTPGTIIEDVTFNNFTIINTAGNAISLEGEIRSLSLNNLTIIGWGQNSPSSAIAGPGPTMNLTANGVRIKSTVPSGTVFTFPGTYDEIDVKLDNVYALPGSNEPIGASPIGGVIVNRTWTGAPTHGTWRRGDRIDRMNIGSVNTGDAMQWACTDSGTPGTWIISQRLS